MNMSLLFEEQELYVTVWASGFLEMLRWHVAKNGLVTTGLKQRVSEKRIEKNRLEKEMRAVLLRE